MQQRTKCNINWQIEGPETPKRILVAKRDGGKEGRVVSQTVFGGTEMMPRHHQLKGRGREKKILRWHKWCCLYLGLLRPNSTSSVYSTNANHVARGREVKVLRGRSGGSYFAYFSFKYFDVCT